jgi:hypothetical protein
MEVMTMTMTTTTTTTTTTMMMLGLMMMMMIVVLMLMLMVMLMMDQGSQRCENHQLKSSRSGDGPGLDGRMLSPWLAKYAWPRAAPIHPVDKTMEGNSHLISPTRMKPSTKSSNGISMGTYGKQWGYPWFTRTVCELEIDMFNR